MLSRRLFCQTLAGVATASQLPAFILPERRPPFAPDPHFIPMLEKAMGIQLLIADKGLFFHLRRKKYTVEEIKASTEAFIAGKDCPTSMGMGISIDSLIVDSTGAPMLDLHKKEDRLRMMNMMVDYLMKNTRPLPHYVRRVDQQPGFRQAMNDIARITRRGVGNVLIANDEGFRRLNGSWRAHKSVKAIRLPLDDRAPFALLGYKGNNHYDTGVILGLRITDEDSAILNQFRGQFGTKDRQADFMQNTMRFARPVFVGNDEPDFNTATYWRRLV